MKKRSSQIFFLTSIVTILFLSIIGCGVDGDGFLEPGMIEPFGGPGAATGPSDTVPPKVGSTSPDNNALEILINITAINVSFSEYIIPSTVSSETFLLKDSSNNSVNGTVTSNGMSATFKPGGYLSPSTIYTATITTGVTDQNNNRLESDYSWSFTTSSKTDFTAPTVLSTSPAWGERDVVLSSIVTVTFSEAMDPLTIKDETVYLQDTMGNRVPAALAFSGTTATLTPVSNFKFRGIYTICIKNSVADLEGNKMQYDYFRNFSTVENSGFFKPYTTIWAGNSDAQAVAIGDVNGDNKNDVILVNRQYNDPVYDNKLLVYSQTDTGGLSPAAIYATTGTFADPPYSVAIGDINNDGKDEVVLSNEGKNIEVFVQDGLGGLVSQAVYTTDQAGIIGIADLNNDGRLDVASVGYQNSLAVFLQNTGGTLDAPVFYAVSAGAGWNDLKLGDVNNDGLTDIVAMSGQGFGPNVSVLIQKSDSTLEQAVYYDLGGNELAGAVAVGDLNNDGLNDIALAYGWASDITGLGLFYQNSSGTLNSAITFSAFGDTCLQIADINRDGRQDLLALKHDLAVYLQAAGGTMMTAELYDLADSSYNHQAFAVGDINSDGLEDIVIADYNKGLNILYRQAP